MIEKHNIRVMKEFMYELGGDYYIMGSCACEKCSDSKLISMYNDFVKICEKEGFQNDFHDIWPSLRKEIAHAFVPLIQACYVPIENTRMDNAAYELSNNLVLKYGDEIEEQIKRWLKAQRCVDWVIADKQFSN